MLLDGYLSKWEELYSRGAFLSETGSLLKREETLKSGQRLVFVFNHGRAIKRSPPPFANVQHPFDPQRFSFVNVTGEQVMFMLRAAPVDDVAATWATLCTGASAATGGDQHAFIINAFPLSENSGLFVPFLPQRRRQALLEDAAHLGLFLARALCGGPLRVAFNSLLAGASVNHFHWQIWQPALRLPVEDARFVFHSRQHMGVHKVDFYVSTSHHVTCLLFQHSALPPAVAARVLAFFAATMDMLDIPHNVMLNRTHAFLFPRRPIVLFANGVRPGFPEMCGEVFVPELVFFPNASAAEFVREIREHIAFTKEEFAKAADSYMRAISTTKSA